VHVEVETEPCIAPDQVLYPQVRALLQSMGLEELATDRIWHAQFNALFVQRGLLAQYRWRIAGWLALAWLRQRAVVARLRLRRALGPAYRACMSAMQLSHHQRG
jgi:hypothetical protein